MTGTRNFYIRMMSVFLVCLLVIAASGVSQWAGIAQAAGTWTAKDPAVNTDLNRVEYANGRWVSVGNFGQITTSTNDGETWAAQTKTGTHLGLKYVDWLGKWIIAGSEGRIYTSSNGTAWNLQTSGMEGAPYPDSDLYSVASSADHLVVVGGGGTVLVSADGISWAKQTKLAGDLYNVTYGNGKFVAVGDAGLIYTSPDGYVWTPETSGTGQVLLGVAYGGTTFTAVGLSGMILTSPNGTSWTPQIVPGFTSDLFSVSYGGGKFMASGVGGTLITSSNGIAWATETTGFADRWMNHASYGNGVFLAVGQNGKLIKQSAPLSTNTNLTSLNLSVGTLAPPFSSGTTMYSASVGNSTASVDVTPTVEDANATVTVNGSAVTSGTAQTVPLNIGGNTITIQVTAQSGATKDYKVTVNRAMSSNNNLSNLTLSTGSLTPGFSPGTTNYTQSVLYAVTSVDVRPTVEDSASTVTVNGTAVASGSATTVSSLALGTNTITVVVTAQNGSTKTYSVTVTRGAPSGNADLSNLTLSSGTLTPGFDPTKISYDASVTNGVTSINVTPTTADSTATVSVKGTVVASGNAKSVSLTVGANAIPVIVTAENGTSKTYTVTVHRAPSSNTTLGDLTLSAGSLSPSFSAGVRNYTASVVNGVTSVNVTPVYAESTQSVTINGTPVADGGSKTISPLVVGETTVTVVVTAENGDTGEYEIIVTREKSDNADLSGLSISTGSLTPGFDPNHLSYTASDVANAVTSVSITPTVADSKATVTVGGSPVASGTGKSVSLSTGANAIPVVVTAENGSTKTYTVNVTRAKSSNNDLSNLVLSKGTLDPVFAAGEENYTAAVGNEVTSLDVTPTLADNAASMTVNGSPVASGSPKTVTSLLVGENTITVSVRAENGLTKDYVIKVTRAQSSNADLSNLTLSAGTLAPGFDAGLQNYTATVGNEVTSLNVTPTVADGTATVTVNGAPVVSGNVKTISPLTVGSNTITLVVTAENGSTKEYEVIVTRALKSNADLSNLTLSTGGLTPGFASGTKDYTASVGNEVTSLTVTPTVADSTASVTVNGAPVVSGNAHAVALAVGANPIQVVVTAENGTTKTYTVTVTRAASNNADLSKLTISAGTLSPAFSSGTTDYTADVTASVNRIEITPTVADGTAKVKVNGTTVTSGNAFTVKLKNGANTIMVLVTAENGATKTYSLIINRQNNGGGGGGGRGGAPSDVIDGKIIVVDKDGEPLSDKVTEKIGRNVTMTAAIYAADGQSLLQGGIEVGADGRFLVKKLAPGTYMMFVSPIAPNGEKLAGSEGTLTVNENGSSVMQTVRINPFGSVRDSLTNQSLDGAKINLYWADTERNRSKGRTPGTLVDLPKMPEMKPSQNLNGQLSYDGGQFGFLVFQESSYYIIAEKDGYETYDSRLDPNTGIIQVGRVAVQTDIKMKALDTRDHQPYILGYADGTFQPNKGITREELATILARLYANEEAAASATASFGDVNSTHWAAKSIAYVNGKHVMVGYPDGNFYPNRVVTRAEMAMILAKLKQLPNGAGTSAFTDLGDHWAKDAILKAEKAGLLDGFPDSTFRPNGELTRAQAVVILNKLLERNPQSVQGSQKWTDVAPDFWAYKDIMEASVPHKYHLVDGAEVWIK